MEGLAFQPAGAIVYINFCNFNWNDTAATHFYIAGESTMSLEKCPLTEI